MEPAKKKPKLYQRCQKIEEKHEVASTVKNGKDQDHQLVSKSPNLISQQVKDSIYSWYTACVNKGINISNSQIQEKAIEYNRQFGGKTDFVASKSYLLAWKKKYNIQSTVFQKICKNESVREYFRKRLIGIIEENRLSKDQVFICGEVKINYKTLPTTKSINQLEKEAFKENNLNNASVGASEELTIMICSNTAGTLKLPLMVIGKSAISSHKKLPVFYKYRDRELIGGQAFNEWQEEEYIPRLKRFLKQKKEPPLAVLIVSHFQTAGKIVENKIQTVYLPPNASEIIASLNRKVLKEFKLRFWLKMLSYIFDSTEKNSSPLKYNIRIEEALDLLMGAWNETSVTEYLHFWNEILPETDEVKIKVEEKKNLISDLRSLIAQFQSGEIEESQMKNESQRIKKVKVIDIKLEESGTNKEVTEVDLVNCDSNDNQADVEGKRKVNFGNVKGKPNFEAKKIESKIAEAESNKDNEGNNETSFKDDEVFTRGIKIEKNSVQLSNVTLEDCITSLKNVIHFFKSRSKYDEFSEDIQLLRRLMNKAAELVTEMDVN